MAKPKWCFKSQNLPPTEKNILSFSRCSFLIREAPLYWDLKFSNRARSLYWWTILNSRSCWQKMTASSCASAVKIYKSFRWTLISNLKSNKNQLTLKRSQNYSSHQDQNHPLTAWANIIFTTWQCKGSLPHRSAFFKTRRLPRALLKQVSKSFSNKETVVRMSSKRLKFKPMQSDPSHQYRRRRPNLEIKSGSSISKPLKGWAFSCYPRLLKSSNLQKENYSVEECQWWTGLWL